jgi:hypothetical protein
MSDASDGLNCFKTPWSITKGLEAAGDVAGLLLGREAVGLEGVGLGPEGGVQVQPGDRDQHLAEVLSSALSTHLDTLGDGEVGARHLVGLRAEPRGVRERTATHALRYHLVARDSF